VKRSFGTLQIELCPESLGSRSLESRQTRLERFEDTPFVGETSRWDKHFSKWCVPLGDNFRERAADDREKVERRDSLISNFHPSNRPIRKLQSGDFLSLG